MYHAFIRCLQLLHCNMNDNKTKIFNTVFVKGSHCKNEKSLTSLKLFLNAVRISNLEPDTRSTNMVKIWLSEELKTMFLLFVFGIQGRG